MSGGQFHRRVCLIGVSGGGYPGKGSFAVLCDGPSCLVFQAVVCAAEVVVLGRTWGVPIAGCPIVGVVDVAPFRGSLLRLDEDKLRSGAAGKVLGPQESTQLGRIF